jgi:hypothetical protein
MRHMFGYTYPALTNDAMGTPTFLSRDPTQIQPWFTTIDPFLDVDGNGVLDPLTDGAILFRYMSGIRGPALTQGLLGTGAIKNSAQVESYINWLTQ